MADTLSIKSTEDAKETEAKKRHDEAERNARMEDAKLAYYAMLNLTSWKRIDENYSDKAESVTAEREKDQSATLETDDKNRGKLRAGVYKRTPPIVDGEDYQIKVTGDDDKNHKGYSIIPAPKGKDFDKSYGALIDFVKANSGNDVITLNWTNEQIQNGYCDPQAVKAILLIAKEKNVAVQFGPELQGYLTSSKIKPEVREGLFRLKVDVEQNHNLKSVHKDLRKKNMFELKLKDLSAEKSLSTVLSDELGSEATADDKRKAFLESLIKNPDEAKVTSNVSKELTEIERRLEKLESAKKEMDSHVSAATRALYDRHSVLFDEYHDKADQNEINRLAGKRADTGSLLYDKDLDPEKISELWKKEEPSRTALLSAIEKERVDLGIRIEALKQISDNKAGLDVNINLNDDLKSKITSVESRNNEVDNFKIIIRLRDEGDVKVTPPRAPDDKMLVDDIKRPLAEVKSKDIEEMVKKEIEREIGFEAQGKSLRKPS